MSKTVVCSECGNEMAKVNAGYAHVPLCRRCGNTPMDFNEQV